MNCRTTELRKELLPLLIPGCSSTANATYGVFSESKDPFPDILNRYVLQQYFFVCLLVFWNVTEEHQGYLKYKHPKTSQTSNVTVSLQFPAQLWSSVTNDNTLQKQGNNPNLG